MGLLGTSSPSLLIFSRVSAGCGRYSLTISSIDNDRDLLVATSLSKSTSPSVPMFSVARSGLVLRSWFSLNSNSSTALYPTLLFYSSNFIPPPLPPRLNESPWSLTASVWASTEISDFRKKLRIIFLVTSFQAVLSIIMASKSDVRRSCLSLSTALIILQITRDQYLAFNDLQDG